MISESQYLKAKALVTEYEKNNDTRPMNIAVISKSKVDFMIWKNENYPDYKFHGRINQVEKFEYDNKIYYCISNMMDLHSLAIDDIIVTPTAFENKYYNTLIVMVKFNLRIIN